MQLRITQSAPSLALRMSIKIETSIGSFEILSRWKRSRFLILRQTNFQKHFSFTAECLLLQNLIGASATTPLPNQHRRNPQRCHLMTRVRARLRTMHQAIAIQYWVVGLTPLSHLLQADLDLSDRVSICGDNSLPPSGNFPSSAETGGPSFADTSLARSVLSNPVSAGSSRPGGSVKETQPSGFHPVTSNTSAQGTSEEGIQEVFQKFLQEVIWHPTLRCSPPGDKKRGGDYDAMPSQNLHGLLDYNKEVVYNAMRSWWKKHESPSLLKLGDCSPLELTENFKGKGLPGTWYCTPVPSTSRSSPPTESPNKQRKRRRTKNTSPGKKTKKAKDSKTREEDDRHS